jgi:hypothetical protein
MGIKYLAGLVRLILVAVAKADQAYQFISILSVDAKFYQMEFKRKIMANKIIVALGIDTCTV